MFPDELMKLLREGNILGLYEKTNGLDSWHVQVLHAVALEQMGKIKEAVAFFDKLTPKNEVSFQEDFLFHFFYGLALHRDRRPQEAAEQFTNVKNKTENDPYLIFLALLFEARLHIGSKEFIQANTFLNDAENYIQHFPKDYYVALFWNDKGLLNRFEENFDLAELYFENSLEITANLKSPHQQAITLTSMANLEFVQANYLKAAEIHKKAIQIRKELDDEWQLAISYVNISACYAEAGNVLMSLEYAHQCYELAKKLEDKYLLGIAANNIGNGERLMGNHKASIPWIKEAYEISMQFEDYQGAAEEAWNLARCYATLGEMDKAEDIFQNNIGILRKYGNHNDLSSALRVLGEFYHARGEFKKACDILLEAVEHGEASDIEFNTFMARFYLYQLLEPSIMRLLNIDQKCYQSLKDNLLQTNNPENILHIPIRQQIVIATEEIRTQGIIGNGRVILEDILHSYDLQNIEYDLLEHVLLHLTKLLLSEYQITFDKALFDAFLERLDQLDALAAKERSHKLTVEIYLMRSILYRYEKQLNQQHGEIDPFLLSALEISEEQGLILLKRIIEQEIDLLFQGEESTELSDLTMLLENILNNQIENLVDPSFHIIIDGKQLCDPLETTKPLENVHGLKCLTCREINFDNGIKSLIRLKLFEWKCKTCGAEKSLSDIHNLIQDLEDNSTQELFTPLNLRSLYIDKLIHFKCTNIRCVAPEIVNFQCNDVLSLFEFDKIDQSD